MSKDEKRTGHVDDGRAEVIAANGFVTCIDVSLRTLGE
jgi:hypothetical protein